MKSVILDERGYTADGEWRLVPMRADDRQMMAGSSLGVSTTKHVPGTTNYAAAVYRAMVAESPAPELAEAVPYLLNGTRFKMWITNEGACYNFEGYQELNGKWVALVDATDGVHLTAPPAPAMPAEWRDFIEGLAEMSVTSECEPGDLQSIKDEAKALLQSPAALIVERLEGISIQARLSADANVLIEDGYIMRAANIKEAIERIAELEARNHELQADAERYRYLRSQCGSMEPLTKS